MPLCFERYSIRKYGNRLEEIVELLFTVAGNEVGRCGFSSANRWTIRSRSVFRIPAPPTLPQWNKEAAGCIPKHRDGILTAGSKEAKE